MAKKTETSVITDEMAAKLTKEQQADLAAKTDGGAVEARCYECGMVAWKTIYDRCVVLGWSNVQKV
jgi:hypothetical protein